MVDLGYEESHCCSFGINDNTQSFLWFKTKKREEILNQKD